MGENARASADGGAVKAKNRAAEGPEMWDIPEHSEQLQC
jgi:hypothetical protein